MKILVAVKDLAVQAYAHPFTVQTTGEATRSFRDEVNRTDGKSAVAAHPEDYELYKVGEYDDQTGEIYASKDLYPELIVRAKDLLTPRE